MAKEPFLRIVPAKALKRITVKRLFIAYLVVFWILPLMRFIPTGDSGVNLMNWYVLIVAPFTLLSVGVVLGMNYGFYPLLTLGVAVGTFPTALVFRFLPAWQYSIFFAAIAFGGNLLTEILKTSSRDYYKNKTKV